jgi:hypothetical protein
MGRIIAHLFFILSILLIHVKALQPGRPYYAG